MSLIEGKCNLVKRRKCFTVLRHKKKCGRSCSCRIKLKLGTTSYRF